MCRSAASRARSAEGSNREVLDRANYLKQVEDKWVRIGDTEYDVSGFKHPGGSVINYMLTANGADATEAYREFHYRSKKADKYLKSLPQRPAEGGSLKTGRSRTKGVSSDEVIDADFAVFRAQLEEEGFFEPSPAHTAYRLAELAAIFGAACVLLRAGHVLASVVLFALFNGRCGWVQHEGGHGSLTGNLWWDKRIQAMTIGFGLGSSGDMWNSMHNKHHATPQKAGHDMDLDTTPLVAFFANAVETNRPRPYSGLWLKFQAWTFLPVTSGILVMGFWLLFLHPRNVVKKGKWEEGAWMLAAHVARTALVAHLAQVSYLRAYGLVWAAFWAAGMYLFGHFSTSHTHLDVVDVTENPSWVRYAVEHTVDIDTHKPWVNWIMGYLNCQVVHHMFPQMPQFRQPEVSKRLKAFCDKHGLRYQVLSYWGAWYETFSNLNRVGGHYHEKSKRPNLAHAKAA